jgi:hypothetical protein
MTPANSPPKPKEKVNEVSLNIAQKLFEMPTCNISLLPPQGIHRARKRINKKIKRKQ